KLVGDDDRRSRNGHLDDDPDRAWNGVSQEGNHQRGNPGNQRDRGSHNHHLLELSSHRKGRADTQNLEGDRVVFYDGIKEKFFCFHWSTSFFTLSRNLP